MTTCIVGEGICQWDTSRGRLRDLAHPISQRQLPYCYHANETRFKPPFVQNCQWMFGEWDKSNYANEARFIYPTLCTRLSVDVWWMRADGRVIRLIWIHLPLPAQHRISVKESLIILSSCSLSGVSLQATSLILILAFSLLYMFVWGHGLIDFYLNHHATLVRRCNFSSVLATRRYSGVDRSS